MTSTREDYVILSEALRKVNFNPSYELSARERKVLASLLEHELKDSPKRKTKGREPSGFEWQ